MPNPEETFSFKSSNFVKNAFINALRFGFKNIAAFSTVDFTKYTYDEAEATSKIQIYKTFPRRIVKPPTIIVQAGSVDANISYLGENEYLGQDPATGAPQKVIFNGKLNVPIAVQVFGKNTTDREKVTDLCTLFIRHLFRHKFAEHGIAYTKIRLGGEAQTEWDNQVLYTNSVNVDCYVEYKSELTLVADDLIETLDITCDVDDPI